MPSLTDTAIRQAMKRVELITEKQENLADGEGRGTSRLVLVLKPMPKRVTADWMAQQWRDGKRTKKKLGSYPSMSLAQAREIFKRDFADVIQKGRSIKIATDTRRGTVADLFEGYVAALKAAGKPSWKETEKGLKKIADTLGRNRLAREVEAEEIVELIRPIGHASTEGREVELATGAAGTVYLCHPFLVHAAQPHLGQRPRFMAQPPLRPKGEFDPALPPSPVQVAIRQACGLTF